MATNKEQEAGQPGREIDEKVLAAAEERTTISADVVHEAIRAEGAAELKRPSSALFWSALAAGLSIGFSMVAEGLLTNALPDQPWRPLIAKLGYSVGFLIVILGRQQLFTENTLTPILPLLDKFTGSMFRNVLRLWGITFAANMLGAFIFAVVVAYTNVFSPELRETFAAMGLHMAGPDFITMVWKGIFAGWLIALLIWLLPVAESARVITIIIMTYMIGLGSFAHIVAGSVEVFYAMLTGALGWDTGLLGVWLPALIGNIIGGVSLVAALNHAQVVAGGGKEA